MGRLSGVSVAVPHTVPDQCDQFRLS